MKSPRHILAVLATFAILLPAALAAEKVVNTTTISDQASPDRAVISQQIERDDSTKGLTVRKEVVESSIQVGQSARFTVTITNQSTTATSTNVVLEDFFDEEFFSLETGSIQPTPACYGDASRIRCTFASLAPQAQKIITYRLVAKKSGSSANVVQVTDAAGNLVEDDVLVLIGKTKADFVVKKEASRSTMMPGEEVEFTVTISNPTADQTFTNLQIIDDFPEQFLEYINVSATGLTCQGASTQITCSLPTLAPSASYKFVARYRAKQNGSAINTVTAKASNGQIATASKEVQIINAAAPFVVKKVANKSAIKIGDNIEYTITIQNAGQEDVANVKVIDVYPEQLLEFQNVVPGNGLTCEENGGKVSCDIANFVVGSLYTFTTRYTAIAAGGAGNSVTVSDQFGRSANDTVDVIILNPDTPFYVSKEPNRPSANVGEDVIFTVNIGLLGDLGAIRRISLLDDFAEEFLQIKEIQTTDGIECVRDASEIRCMIDNPVAGETFTIVSRFTTLKPGTADNTVIMTGDDGTIVGETASHVIVLDPGNPFLITKSPNKKVVDLGEEVGFTVSITNRTQSETLKNVTVIDDFPQELLEIDDITTSLGFNCQSDAGEIRCQIESFAPGATYTFASRFTTLAAGTASNTVTATEENGPTNTASASVSILNPGDPFLITKSPSKNKIEVGERVDYMIRITNRTPAQTFTNVTIVDDFPEGVLKLENIVASEGLTCTRDNAEIRCQIEEFLPQTSYLLSAKYLAKETGQALNTVTVTEQNGQSGTATSNVEIAEPEITELHLSSDCEGRTVLINQKCLLTVVARYRYLDEKIVSQDAQFLNFENIGTLGGNLLVTTEAGIANIIATYENVTSNPIVVEVVEELAVATDPDGNIIAHLPVRVAGGLPNTSYFSDVLEVGDTPAGTNVVAKSSRLVLQALGGASGFSWILSDKNYGTLTNFSTGVACPETNNSVTCSNAESVIFDAKSNQGTVVLRLADNEGRGRTITLHILPPATESITLRDKDGNALPAAVEYPRDRTITFTAEETLADGKITPNAEAKLQWEYSYNGGEWLSSSAEGVIAGGVLQAYRNGTYVIRAKRTQNLAMPGVASLTQMAQDVTSSEVTVQIGDPVPYIDSIRTAKNLGMAEGTTETIYLRLRHFGTIGDISDIELDFIKGRFQTVESIPADVQHFQIDIVPEQILAQNAAKNTVLLEIPFLVPILDDLRDGPHTIRVIISNRNGLGGKNAVTGLLPVYLGMPLQGDANLDGKVDLVDAVMTARFLSGTVMPDALQIFATDLDRSGGITLRDFLDFFRDFLLAFLR